jgi:hypothetical protein
MEICLHERDLAHRNAHIRVVCRVLDIDPLITKNGNIGEVTEIPTRRHR